MPETYIPAKAAPIWKDERVTVPAFYAAFEILVLAYVVTMLALGTPWWVFFPAMVVFAKNPANTFGDLANGIQAHRRYVERCNEVRARYFARQASVSA